MDVANPLQTTLLILYFIGQPGFDPKGVSKDKLEVKTNWTLQSTSQIETASPQACRTIGNKLIERFDKVSTMTVRAYCLCADASGVACPGTKEMAKELGGSTSPAGDAVEVLGRRRK